MNFGEILLYFSAVLVSLITTAYVYLKWKYGYWARRGVPFDKPSLLMGSLKGIGKKFSLGGKISMVYQECPTAKVAGMFLMVKPLAVVGHLDLVKAILIKDFHKLSDRGLYWNEEDDPLSANLLNLPEERWKYLRSKLSPTFSSGKMKLMMPIVKDVADVLVKVLRATHGEQTSAKTFFARYTTDVIGNCAFGIECNSLEDSSTEFAQYVRLMSEPPKSHPAIRIMNLAFGQLSRRLGFKQNRNESNLFFHRVVTQTVAYREKEKVQRDDFLNILISMKANGELTVDQIAAQVFIFQFAGYETSAATLTFAAYELAVHPEIQERARQEVQRVVKEFNNELSYEAIHAMPYLDCVINETLRKYPPFTSIFRRVTVDSYEIPGTGVVLSKDDLIAIPTFGIHRNPDLYPEPETFDPDRFLPEAVQKRHPMAFLPFGEGPRNCIGLRFAMMENKVVLARTLMSLRLEKGDDMPDRLEFSPRGVILQPTSTITIKFIDLAVDE